jgi:hypothetical protein
MPRQSMRSGSEVRLLPCRTFTQRLTTLEGNDTMSLQHVTACHLHVISLQSSLAGREEEDDNSFEG